MPAASNLDWLYHLLGYTLAAAGLLLLLWAFFWDRSRGRRRCPKCWYDMSGVPGLTCPECGKEHASPRRLGRTRRRWRTAAAAGVLLLGPCVLQLRDMWNRGTLQKYVPNQVLVALVPINSYGWLDKETEAERELLRRIEADQLGPRSWQFLLDRLFRASPKCRAEFVNCRSQWPADRDLPVFINPPCIDILHEAARPDRARVRLVRTAGGTAGPWVEAPGNILLGPALIGKPSLDRPVEVDVELFRGQTHRWTGRLPLTVQVTPGLTLHPVTDAALDQRVVAWMKPAMYVTQEWHTYLYVEGASRFTAVGQHLSMGVRYTLTQGGKARATANKTWGPELSPSCGNAPTGAAIAINWIAPKPSPTELTAGNWEITIEGDHDLALLDFDRWGWLAGQTPSVPPSAQPWQESPDYWAGSVRVPLPVRIP